MIVSSIIRKESLTLSTPRLQTLIILSEFDSFRLGVEIILLVFVFFFFPCPRGIAVKVFLILLFVLYPRTDLNRDTGLFNRSSARFQPIGGLTSQGVSHAPECSSGPSKWTHMSFPEMSSVVSRSITG